MKAIGVIPARMGSSRFPGKPLVSIAGLPMVEHVRRRALLCKGLSEVVVATCDREILEAVENAGGRAVMTLPTHERCTDRVEEAARGLEGDLFVTIQGDEPLLDPIWVDRVIEPFFSDARIGCTNLLSELEGEEDLANANIVKAACDARGEILFFARRLQPSYPNRLQAKAPIYRQTGIQAFRAETLREFSRLSPTPFEQMESVDMFRLIEHGRPIRGVVTEVVTFGVDKPEHVAGIEKMLREDPRQKALWAQMGDVAVC
ncbi:MAG: 3-deoxy-manno-octulosonate cytidylyltransferase [Verrucomicrobiae bacterium]|nr:3-deoxy-manno-octulosonate cytidylyltransferase [Verrucomicrobiae bacterium]